jgi:hypothetical protein
LDLGYGTLGYNTLYSQPSTHISFSLQSKSIIVLALVASASAFAPAAKPAFVTSLAEGPNPNPKPTSGEEAAAMGWSGGGEAHTRNPTPVESDDARKTIPEGESFEEYMKRRAAENA